MFVGRESTVVPGRFGEALEVRRALLSPGQAKAYPGRPLFLCLHGWGSNETDVANVMRYVAPFNDYVSLRAPLVLQEEDFAGGAYSWFHDAVPHGGDLDRDAYAAAKAIDTWVADRVDERRDVVPLGFSQGGVLAVHLLRVHPERYRAAVCLSGFVAAGEVPQTAPADGRLAGLQIPVFYGYGDADAVIAHCELSAAAAWLEEHTWLTVRNYRHLDHAVSVEEFNDIRQWLILNDIASGVI